MACTSDAGLADLQEEVRRLSFLRRGRAPRAGALALQIHEISEETLPTDWKVIVAPVMELRDIGTKWLKSSSSAVARVPSVITPGEFNYLLNPLHIDFRRIRAEKALAFEYDPRLWKK
jgi:RES domain-containing protein